VPECILSSLSRHGEQYHLWKPELQPEAGCVAETRSFIVCPNMRAEPAMFANFLNEVLFVMVKAVRVGIKGCEHEMHVGS
jgi:hypothetical protein